jgi:hypothetical protein
MKPLAYIGAVLVGICLLVACSGTTSPRGKDAAASAPNGTSHSTASGSSAVTKSDAEGVAFLESHLAELVKFKENREFHKIGFSQTGRYYRWLDEVEAEHKADPYDTNVGIAVGDLLMLGLAYVDSKGIETQYTTFAREQIEKVIADHKSSAPKD